MTDTTDGSTIRNNYDQTDRLAETEQRDGSDTLRYRTLIEYDVKNRVKAFKEATGTDTYKTGYTYDADNRVTKVQYNGSDTTKIEYTYDPLNRITARTLTNSTACTSQYSYVQGAAAYGTSATTPLIESITQGSGTNALNYSYPYDNRGNITSETRNNVTITYEYDALGQLTRVNDPGDPTAGSDGTTWIYTYDLGGNMLSKTAYAHTTETPTGTGNTTNYTCDSAWKDKLTANGTYPLTYDDIGNLKTYAGWTYTWEAGRLLTKQVQNSTVVEYDYNGNGLRTKKTVSNNTSGYVYATYNYTYNGKTLTHLTKNSDSMRFFYDAQGRPAMVDYNGTK
ncbi:MAG: hypothetical protein IJJ23_06365 [Clostridia bacterium]|nr:hypothetical protein [Clostridia bacterium]